MPAVRSASKNTGRGVARNQDAAPLYRSNKGTKIHGSLADTVEISTAQFDGLACRKGSRNRAHHSNTNRREQG